MVILPQFPSCSLLSRHSPGVSVNCPPPKRLLKHWAIRVAQSVRGRGRLRDKSVCVRGYLRCSMFIDSHASSLSKTGYPVSNGGRLS